MPANYSEYSAEVRIAARGLADGKFNVAFSQDPNAFTLAEAEYDRLMQDYIQHGENSDLAKAARERNIEL
ncbi:MAG TPA: hypothetical protein VHV10_04940 [Ktedonobacteraceae bacterium]|jgi:hypothetical protein|nr:hypothetical protein [Ktedonobacteraceae bacterium]